MNYYKFRLACLISNWSSGGLKEWDKSGQIVVVLVLLGGSRCLNEGQKEKRLALMCFMSCGPDRSELMLFRRSAAEFLISLSLIFLSLCSRSLRPRLAEIINM